MLLPTSQLLPALLICAASLTFLLLERARPGRRLLESPGWYLRACALNLCQLALTGLGGVTWNRYFREHTLLSLGGWAHPVIEGACYWVLGSLVFYAWHRIRHLNGFWQVLHQVHHSASRIEALTAFYKHPMEIAADSVLAAFLIYAVCGASAEAGAWTSLFGVLGEFFYHANIRTPRWVGWVLQRPEHHAIHHQLGVHSHNFGDLTLWDRLFGTFRDTDDFVGPCGLPGDAEQRLLEMLRFKDVCVGERAAPAADTMRPSPPTAPARLP